MSAGERLQGEGVNDGAGAPIDGGDGAGSVRFARVVFGSWETMSDFG